MGIVLALKNGLRRLRLLSEAVARLHQFRHRFRERRRVHHALSLELHPDLLGMSARENDVELQLRPTVSDEGMIVNQIDQVVARRQHVRPGANVLFQLSR